MRNPRSNAWKSLNTDGILDAIILDIPKEDAKYKVKDVESYLQYMSNDSVWGDHIVLQTLTDIFNVYVEIINTHLSHAIGRLSCPTSQRAQRITTFHAIYDGKHYQSLITNKRYYA